MEEERLLEKHRLMAKSEISSFSSKNPIMLENS
jgi:hypothetical protein